MGVRGAKFCHGVCGAVLVTAAAAMLAGPATASIITLSTHSSDATLPSVLNATLDFDVTGSLLTLTVTNTTVVPNTFNINELYFNGRLSMTVVHTGSAGIDNLTFIPAPGALALLGLAGLMGMPRRRRLA